MQQLGSLLDHLVGERQKIHRQLDARGLCGLEVDDELSGFPHRVMSASPPKADMRGARTDVGYGPKADVSASAIAALMAAS